MIIRACPCFAGSAHYGLRFARCFARFAPPCASRKTSLPEAKTLPPSWLFFNHKGHKDLHKGHQKSLRVLRALRGDFNISPSGLIHFLLFTFRFSCAI
jgi:hypothetical protein